MLSSTQQWANHRNHKILYQLLQLTQKMQLL